jgi:hypothetical protein
MFSPGTYHRHPCKSSVKGKARVGCSRSGERVVNPIRSCRCARRPLGGGFLHSAEPDIHLLPRSPWSRRRRLSLGSLPVPKQFEESLGSCLRRPAGDLRDLAACASILILMFFPSQEGFYAAVRFVGTQPRARNPYCIFLQPASRPPSSVPQRARPDCRSRVAVPFREAGPARHCSAEPVGPPPPAPAVLIAGVRALHPPAGIGSLRSIA